MKLIIIYFLNCHEIYVNHIKIDNYIIILFLLCHLTKTNLLNLAKKVIV